MEQLTTQQFSQEKYRWIIVILVGLCHFVNGLANNAIIPIASKVQIVYQLSSSYVNAPVIASFLIYSISNFPANYIIDTKGLRISFLIGSGLYAVGLLLFTLINRGYYFVLIGSFFVALGQPFIVNCPAKVATFWFLSKNRTFATSIMIGANLVSIGTTFILPTIFIGEGSYGDKARSQIFYLYAVYFFTSAVIFVLVFIFMKTKPNKAPSLGAQTQKSSLKQSIQILKKDKNLWKFIPAYMLVYGTVIALGSEANLLFKPYGFTDIQIGICAITMLVLGVVGSIAFSLYIKKTNNYKMALRAVSVLSFIIIGILLTQLQVLSNLVLTIIIIGFVGFCCTPIITICYDLGCQLAFPMGQAQVTGILNGASLFFTFLTTLIVSAAIGFGDKQDTMIVMIIFMSFILIGCFLFFRVKIILKRKNLENGRVNILDESRVNQIVKLQFDPNTQRNKQTQDTNSTKQVEMSTVYSNNSGRTINEERIQKKNYQNLIEQYEGL